MITLSHARAKARANIAIIRNRLGRTTYEVVYTGDGWAVTIGAVDMEHAEVLRGALNRSAFLFVNGSTTLHFAVGKRIGGAA